MSIRISELFATWTYCNPDVLLICPTRHRPSIYHHIHSSVSPSSLSIDLQTFDEDANDGTCALLRHFSSRISEDFVIVPCDFIPLSSLPLSLVLNKFRVEAPFRTLLVTTCWYASQPQDKASLVEEWGPPSATFPVVWDPLTETLLHIDTPDDQDKNPDEIELRTSMLSMWEYILHLRLTFLTPQVSSNNYVDGAARLPRLRLQTFSTRTSIGQTPFLITSRRVPSLVVYNPIPIFNTYSPQNRYRHPRQTRHGNEDKYPTEFLRDQQAGIHRLFLRTCFA